MDGQLEGVVLERRELAAAVADEVVVMAVADKFATVATNDLGAICMATPAIADGTLFFRTRSKLVAIESP